MPTYSLPHIFRDGEVFDPVEVNENFAALAQRLGSLTFRDLSSTAAIQNNQLAHHDFEFCISGTPQELSSGVYSLGELVFPVADTYQLVGIGLTVYNSTGSPVAGQYRFSYGEDSGSLTTIATLNYTPPSTAWESVNALMTDTITGSANDVISLIMQAGTGYPEDGSANEVLPSTVTFKFKRTGGLV